jgi:RNA polymerase sigma factor (TIGR02999 family)
MGDASTARSDERPQPIAEAPIGAKALFERLYVELRSLAERYLDNERKGHTLQPTALVHEAYLRLAASSHEWTESARFRALAARVMRNVLVDHALARKAEKRGGGCTLLTLEADTPLASAADVNIEALDEALKRLAALDERKARVVELRFFGGLTADETARELSVSLSTVEADWRMSKAWLRSELGKV